MPRPSNVGIKAIEIYFPRQVNPKSIITPFLNLYRYVCQSDLETHFGASPGKYTIGLGQRNMSFCDDLEDVYSFALTVTSNLLKKYNIDVSSIGRLEVGTETSLDKSKSVKTVLMQLFGNNTSIEGADTMNACYGGTNALLNSLNWIESSAWDGRDAIIVASDIAVYPCGNARPAGGAGAIALLIGPDAPIVAEPGLRGTFMQHVYDFYKPDPSMEYGFLDAHYSVLCYIRALDASYQNYCEREAKSCKGKEEKPRIGIDRFDYMIFHAPTCKVVQKSYARLLYHDYLANPDAAIFSDVPRYMRSMSYESSLTDKQVERTFMTLSEDRFRSRVQPSLQVATQCGNMYCASVWAGLASLTSASNSEDLRGKRVGLFSYGSGLTSTFMSFRIRKSVAEISEALELDSRLADRLPASPSVYEDTCLLREKAYSQKDFRPVGDVAKLTAGTYYLDQISSSFRREYKIKT
ncbi:hypothetical protein CP533_4227 [Ophiocordyceps camponoti-saundersi (nom. inval.)]|nr:hypothetical protein CP533_4227 [Ophiocordyceps camponoti-saundersi (nom. inval.)]